MKAVLMRPPFRSRQFFENARQFMEYSARTLQQRLAVENIDGSESKSARKDTLYYILEARDPETGKGLPYGSLLSEARLMIAAGSETVATTMCSVYFNLLHNPEKLAKVNAEVRSSFDTTSAIRLPAVNHLQYLNACIEEAMRINPPVPGALDRVVLPGGLTIDGEHIPEGTTICVSAYTIHHDPHYFPDPYSYRPERWIADEATGVTAQDVEKATSAFCAFSHGNRACIGKGLAYAELRLSLARLLYEFDVRFAPDGVTGGGDPQDTDPARRRADEYQMRDIFVAKRAGPELQFRKAQRMQ
jgi:cytochrome P450